MIPTKLVEAAFRRWYILAIPIVLAPALLLMMTGKAPTYAASANIWISSNDGIYAGAYTEQINPYLTPAQNQAAVIRDLLRTKTFRAAVAERAGLATNNVGTNYVGSTIWVGAAGNNVLSIGANTGDPVLSKALVDALIAEFQFRAATSAAAESASRSEYYTNQLDLAKAELDQRSTDLANYSLENPRASSLDAEYQRLVGRVAVQQGVVAQFERSLENVNRQASSVSEGLDAVFNVQDPAVIPAAATPVGITSKLGYPFAGLILGLLIAGAALYLMYKTDHTIRGAEDLAGLDTILLGTVPPLSGTGLRSFERFTPFRWFRRGDYARRIAASLPVGSGGGQ